jgi:hypothetical protein
MLKWVFKPILVVSFFALLTPYRVIAQPQAIIDTINQTIANPFIDLTVQDKPNDIGGSLNLEWRLLGDDTMVVKDYTGVKIYRAKSLEGPYELATTLPARALRYEDSGLEDGQAYYYKIVPFKGDIDASPLVGNSAIPSGQWFHTGRIPILILMIVFSLTAIFFITKAKGGYTFYVRPIAGINAVD